MSTKPLLVYLTFCIVLLISINSCELRELPMPDHVFMTSESQEARLGLVSEPLTFGANGGFKADPDDYTFTEVATISPPIISGTKVQACHIEAYNSKLFVTYNTAGESYKGAIDVFNYNLDLINTTITPVNGLIFPQSDINFIELIPDGADNFEYFLAGATMGYLNENLSSPAFCIAFDPTFTSFSVNDISGYAANSIDHELASSWFSVGSGSNGGLSIIDRTTLSLSNFNPRPNLSAIANSGNQVYQLSMDPCSYSIYDNINTTNTTTTLPASGSDPNQKSSLMVSDGTLFMALNTGGTIIYDINGSSIKQTLSPSSPGVTDSDLLVSNGLALGNQRLFIANGGAGLTIAELDLNIMKASIIGNVQLGQSINHVCIVEENGNGGYLALACGTAGVKIIYYSYIGSAPTVNSGDHGLIVNNTATVGGEVLDNGGTVVTSRGICWATHNNPSVNDNVVQVGQGGGTFVTNIDGLSNSTTYYYRAYAKNNVGIAYGEVRQILPTFTDSRDGHIYPFVTINNQIWMAENLAYLPEITQLTSSSSAEPYYRVYDYTGTSVAEAMATENFKEYGVLYNFRAAVGGDVGSELVPSGIQGICPTGWHMPSPGEWDILINELGGVSIAGRAMKSTSGWENDGSGTNSSGLNVKPGGEEVGSNFQNLGLIGQFWSSKKGTDLITSLKAYYYKLSSASDATHYGSDSKNNRKSIRCVKN